MPRVVDDDVLDPEALSEEQMGLLRRCISRLTALAEEGREGALHVEGEGTVEDVPLPASFLSTFARALAEVAQGRAVHVAAAAEELTTGEAARLLGVSRPHLVQLLKEGKIPFRKVGTHRRVRMKDILVYRKRMQQEAEEAFEELTRQAQELDMGYDSASSGS